MLFADVVGFTAAVLIPVVPAQHKQPKHRERPG
jgi:hypothetical protein